MIASSSLPTQRIVKESIAPTHVLIPVAHIEHFRLGQGCWSPLSRGCKIGIGGKSSTEQVECPLVELGVVTGLDIKALIKESVMLVYANVSQEETVE
jgi:hypothetical protein